MGYPNNPTGAVAKRENLEAIAKIAEEHDLVVISDEIYDRLVYGQEHICFPAFPGMQNRTVLLGGFSKDYAMTGWRIGYAAGPASIINGLVRIHQYSVMSAPTVFAIWRAGSSSKWANPYVEEMLAEYDRRRKLVYEGMNSLGLPTFEPHGAFYVFPSIHNTGLDDVTFAEKLLLEEKVARSAGFRFWRFRDRLCPRVPTPPSYEKLEIALEKIGHFLKRL